MNDNYLSRSMQFVYVCDDSRGKSIFSFTVTSRGNFIIIVCLKHT